MAMDDAKKSIEAQRSVIGYIANAVSRIGNGDYESVIRAFDLVFTDGLATNNNFLLLIKAVISFECGKHHDAISRVDDLIDIVDDKSLYMYHCPGSNVPLTRRHVGEQRRLRPSNGVAPACSGRHPSSIGSSPGGNLTYLWMGL
ncbi:hypothetical protein OG21DRAFT_1333743 [Imleria badia]|nr:hypothetical protein OG21DRAFT_1333743 [Imleria badia]